jgi:O-antigen/teichoic acid export membrane protein
MKLGQTSVIYFLSRLLAAFLGFIATIYIARLLGADPLGVYYLVLGVVSWLAIAGKIGVSGAISKRVSEGEQQVQYTMAGTSFVTIPFLTLVAGLFLLRSHVHDYIGYPATRYIILILLVTLSWSIVSALLKGLHLVHLKGFLSPVRTGSKSVLQIAAAAAGMGVAGLFLGYAAAYLLVFVVGGLFVARSLDGFALPQKRHFRSLFNYAKFAWLGSLQSRMFNYTDVIVLGFFVPSALIGIYGVAWNVAQFLILFGGAISNTLFPEMSELSAKEDPQSVADLVEDALSYAGLLLIPGLIGGTILGERLLRIYGEEFAQGATVLGILILANLLMSYQGQILNTLNAIDRPDLSFRANVVFIIGNLALNLILVFLYGWIGAAVATALSVTLSLVVAYFMLESIVDFEVPYREIGLQWVAAVIMGGVVLASLRFENTHGVLGHNLATVLLLITFGASIYFLMLLLISSEFRATVDRNLPFDVPLVRS